MDVGLLSYPRTGTELVSIPWQEQPMVLVVAPGHPLGKKLVRGRLAPQALAGVTFLGFTRELPIRRAIDRWLRQEGVQVRVQHEFDNIETIKKAVECGSGVAILPEATVGQEVLAGTLVALPLGGAVLTRPLGIVHKKHRHLSPAVRQFVERLAAEVGVVAANSAEVLASSRASNGVLSIEARRGGAGLEGARSAATLSDPIHSGVTDPGVIRPGELFEEGAAAQSNAVRRELLRAPSNAAVGQGLPATGAAPQNSPAQVKQSRGQARAGKLAAVSGTSHTA
ncbi:MAG: LysR family transcriptional regulator substrate-binding protein, partial [Planctomycetaceae bacterium]